MVSPLARAGLLLATVALLVVALPSGAASQGGYQQGRGRGRSNAVPAEPAPPASVPGQYGFDMTAVADAVEGGEGAQALAFYERAAEDGDLARRAAAAGAATATAHRLGLFEKAIRWGTRALELYKAAGADGRILSVYPPLGAAYREVGQRGQARTVLEEGWALAQRPWRSLGPGALSVGGIARGLAQLDFDERNYQAMVTRCRQSVAALDVALARASLRRGDRQRERMERQIALSLAMAGRAEIALGHLAEAETAHDRALKIATERKLSEVELKVTYGLGALALARGEWPRALALFERAIAQATPASRTGMLTWLEAGRAQALDGLGRTDEAVAAARASVGHIEAVRGDLSGPELRSGLLDHKQDIYHRAVRLALKAGRPDEAFALAERSRARAFLDLLGSHTVLSKGQTRALVTEEVRLRAQLAEARARAQDADEHGESEATRRLIDAAEREYAAFLERVRKENREQASLMTVEPILVAEIQALLPEDTSLLEYLVDDHAVILWVVDRTRLTVYQLPGDRRALAGEVSRFRKAIERQDPLEGVLVQARALSRRLLGSALESLAGRRLLIVPHGVLHYLPFSALRTAGDHWLIEDHSLSTLPSASVLRFLAGEGASAPAPALAVGDPAAGTEMALRWASHEARLVGQRLRDATVLVGAEATEARVKALLGSTGLAHFATHAAFDEDDPLSSALYLAPGEGEDGRLEVRELLGLDVRARLVVLSGCETGLGRLSNGDELVGLQRAVLYAGAPAVITTLWRINDRASFELVRAFYDRLEKEGPADALRDAQRETMRTFIHPFAWAAFTLSGVGERP